MVKNVCRFSSGLCGVWTKKRSKGLMKGNKIRKMFDSTVISKGLTLQFPSRGSDSGPEGNTGNPSSHIAVREICAGHVTGRGARVARQAIRAGQVLLLLLLRCHLQCKHLLELRGKYHWCRSGGTSYFIILRRIWQTCNLNYVSLAGFRILICFNAHLDPAYSIIRIQGAKPMRIHAGPDLDPGQTLLSQKVQFWHEK